LKRDGSVVIKVKMDIQVINESELTSYNKVTTIANLAKSQFENSFGHYDENTRTTYQFKINVVEGSYDEETGAYVNPTIISDDCNFIFKIVDDIPSSVKGRITLGRAQTIGNTQDNEVLISLKGITSNTITKTAAHEIG